MRAKRLIAAADELYLEFKDDQDEYGIIFKEEIGELISEFLEEIFNLSNLIEIERRLQDSRKIDTNLIRKVLESVEKEKPQSFDLNFQNGNKRTINPLDHIAKIKGALDPIEDKTGKLGQIELGLRLEMYLDPHFDEVLMSLPPTSDVFNSIKAELVKKLQLLDRDAVLLLWARVRGSFKQTEYRNGFIKYSDIIPEDYWDETSDLAVIIERLALFICKYKPLTILKMIGDGYNGHPAGMPGVAKILSITNNKYIRIQNIDILVIRAASRIVALYRKITYKEPNELAKSIGADPDSLIFDGEYYNEYFQFLEGLKNKSRSELIRLLCSNFKRSLKYAEEYSASRSSVADAIWQYKLGQEIIYSTVSKQIQTSELILQKQMSKFLAEKGILSYGRQFGRSEIDLYVKEMNGEDFAVEVKVYKDSVTERGIKNNLVQLQSYMDQLNQPRGILAVYNFGPDLLISPRKWINGRIWILAINLCSTAPNRRKRSLEIVEARDSKQMITCIENCSATPKKKTSKRRPSIRKKAK